MTQKEIHKDQPTESVAGSSNAATDLLRLDSNAGSPDKGGDSFVSLVDSRRNAFVSLAEDSVGKNLVYQPRGSKFTDVDVPNSLGCAATISNLLRLSDPDFKASDFQISVDGMEKVLRTKFDAYRLKDLKDARPGDVLVGRGGNDGGRHLGVLGDVENGVRQVYHNRNGKLVKEPITKRFKEFDQLYALRLEF